MNIKMATNSQLSTESKKKKKIPNKLSKQPEQEQNHRYGNHLEGYQLGRGRERMREKVQGLRSIIGRYKIVRVMLRIVLWRSQRTYMYDPGTSTKGIFGAKGCTGQREAKGEKFGQLLIA